MTKSGAALITSRVLAMEPRSSGIMLSLVDPEGICISCMIITLAAFEVWCLHMLTLNVSS